MLAVARGSGAVSSSGKQLGSASVVNIRKGDDAGCTPAVGRTALFSLRAQFERRLSHEPERRGPLRGIGVAQAVLAFPRTSNRRAEIRAQQYTPNLAAIARTMGAKKM
jgi:hypothetical protein